MSRIAPEGRYRRLFEAAEIRTSAATIECPAAWPDVRLEPGDIDYVPYAPQRVLTRYVNLILDTFARNIGVNAGVRIISGNTTPVGVGVNISP